MSTFSLSLLSNIVSEDHVYPQLCVAVVVLYRNVERNRNKCKREREMRNEREERKERERVKERKKINEKRK